MTKTYQITRRAFSEYTPVETFTGTYCAATLRSMELQFTNKDGEYLVREPGEPNWTGGQFSQSPMDYL
jgi:hypothetical protein